MKNLFGRLPVWVRATGLTALLALGGYAVASFAMPAGKPGRNDCLERLTPSARHQNVCRITINVRYCFRNDGSEKTCGRVQLAPGDMMPDLSRKLDAARRTHSVLRTTLYACKAPYIPDDIPSRQDPFRLDDGCRKPA